MRLRVLFTNLDDETGCVAHLKTLRGQQLHNSQLPQHRSLAICHSAMIIMRIRCTVLGNLHDGRLSLRSASGVRSDTGKAMSGPQKMPIDDDVSQEGTKLQTRKRYTTTAYYRVPCLPRIHPAIRLRSHQHHTTPL